jgi:hypothetical protein
MFAILIFERNPLQWSELPAAIQTWVRDVGGLAFAGFLLWRFFALLAGQGRIFPEGSTLGKLFTGCMACAALLYVAFGVAFLMEGVALTEVEVSLKKVQTWKFTPMEAVFLTAAGAFALLAVSLPVLLGLGRLSGRRIWAIAKVSIKETIRQRVLWVFTFLILVVLFASWFLDSDQPEFQLRNYVWVVDGSMTLLLLLAASLLAAFSIPGDVRSQTIHTVVTKPVERFEIVLGRFLGFTVLMTAVLAVVTGAGMLYLLRNINEEAKRENYKARVPIYGQMEFKGTEGESVGREWTHRLYITGGSRRDAPVPNYAIWSFAKVPSRLAERDEGVLCEFSFDVYRTHKGEEGKGIFCTFLVVTNHCKVASRNNGRVELEEKPAITRRQKQLEEERKKTTGRPLLSEEDNEIIAGQLAEEFGFFEVPSQEVKNYHTQEILLPAGLFKNVERAAPEIALPGAGAETEDPALRIIVNVNEKSRGQLVGVATHDLYLLDNEKTFEENFIKGAIGLWFRLCLLIGIAVACSTYLSGVISWLCTMFLFVLGIFKDQILQMILAGSGPTGAGPMEAMLKLASGKPVGGELDKTPETQVALAFDEGYRWVMNYLMKLIPDVNRFDLSQYVANGFDISWSGVLLLDNLVPLLGYLLPWAILAYYMMKSREIANPA